MKAYQAAYPVYTITRVLKASASGFYAWMKRSPSEHAQSDVLLGDRIEAISRRSRSTYGRPRIHAEVEGIRISGKRVARLMRNRSICGASRRKTTIMMIRDRDAKPAPDLVERRFTADGPNQLWLTDITYVPTWSGFLYLAVVLDVFSRRVVGWAMADHMRKELVIGALDMAFFDASRSQLFITPIKVRNTHPSPSRIVASPQAFDLRWVLVMTATTMRCVKASTPRLNASCSLSADSARNVKPKPPLSTSSRRGTIRIAAIRRSDISRRSNTSDEHNRSLKIQPKYYPRNRVNIINRYASIAERQKTRISSAYLQWLNV